MNRLVLSTVLCLATISWSADVFPWEGATTLTDKKGQTLVWTVQRVDGEVHITGVHPNWQVEHHAKPDGTPLFTVKKTKAGTTRVTYTAEGAQLERTDAKGAKSHVTITERGLWDGDTLDVRLAGLHWSAGRKAKMKIVDIDAGDGSLVPMVAEYAGEEKCGDAPCHHVHLALDDFRRLFAPTWDYRYATAVGAKYLQHDGDGFVFTAR
jgi:YD repeat-containing protein